MKTTVKHSSETRVLLTIVLDANDLESAEQVALTKLAKDLRIKGFRKGHAPVGIAKKSIDPNTLAQETLENAISRAVAESFIAENLQALERPSVEVQKYVPNDTVEFTAEADVLPEVKLGDYKNLTATKDAVKILKADTDEVIERMQKSMSEKVEIKTAAKLGDEVVIDFLGKQDGEAFDGGSSQDYPLVLGSGSFIPGFEEAIVGAKSGDKLDIPLTFPKNYQAKQLAGAKVVFETTIKKVSEVKLPEVNEEFAAKVGPFTEVSELRKDIERELKARRESESLDKLKDDLVKQLVSRSKVSVPNILREDQVKSIEQDLTQNLMYQGQNLEGYYASKGFADRDEWVSKEANTMADDRIKAGLVLAELSKELKITATSEELDQHIAQYKQQYSKDPAAAKRFDDLEAKREVANRLITEKTVDKLVELNSKK
ncbi:MAG: trigger factor [Candidatus Saccharimonas sp.]